ncbi:hypothetical protein IJ674_02120 [bacterium]|nr:hypothetical protein [bacterium]
MRRFLSAILIVSILGFNTALAQEPLKGSVSETGNYQEDYSKLFTGKIETLDRHDVINMTVSQVLDSSVSMEGDEFFAEVTSDVYGDKGIIIPKGTKAHGKIDLIKGNKRLGRMASLDLSFDYLITPDGREIEIEGKMSTKLHPIAEAGKIVAQDVGYTVAGGAVGSMLALQWLGLEAAIASQGYTIAGGAAIGGAVGLGAALIRKGGEVLIAPGDQIKVKINTSVDLPVYKEEALKKEEIIYKGINININNVKHEKDPFGNANTITLSLLISNMSTDKTLSGFDMALENDYGVKFSPSIFGNTKLMFRQIKPGDRVIADVSFSVDNLNRDFWLVFFDRRTGNPITKISVDNAYKKVSKRTKKKNERVRNSKAKKNYKKEDDFMQMDF